MNEKKQNILTEGLKAFAQNSYEEASLNHILEQAEVSKGTFYHYYHDKLDLYLELVGICIEKKADFINTLSGAENGFDPNDDFFTAIKKQAMINIGFMENYPLHYRLSLKLSDENEMIKTAVRQKHSRKLEGGFSDMIDMAYLKGEFCAKYPKGFVKNIMTHMMTHYDDLLFPDRENISTDSIEATLDLYFEFLKNGFSAK